MKYRAVTSHHIEVVTSNGESHELAIEYKPSFIMGQYEAPALLQEEPWLVLGYLMDDQDCENPLTSCDGMGAIFSSHRHAGRDAHYAMQQALGLDTSWTRDLDHETVVSEASARLHALIRDHLTAEFVAFTLSAATDGFSSEAAWEELLFAFQHLGGHYWGHYYACEFAARVGEIAPSWTQLLDEAWEHSVKEGQIGDPYAVVLDCYEHGGQVWSLSGGGTRCRWDTAVGAGVWVPDDSLRSELDELRKGEGLAMARAQAREYASQALESYNAWLAGDCYGVSVASFHRSSDGKYEPIQEDACWGYVGSKWALEIMREEAEGAMSYLQKQQSLAA